jgi:CRP-like cAMP-binding protein
MSDTIWFLKRCSLFERLTADECRRLESRSLASTFVRGSMIYFPGEPGEAVLLLTNGRVKVLSVTPDGRETILALIEPGEMFGELALFDAGARGEYAEAVEESTVLAIPREEILWLMGRRPDVALGVTKLLGFRLRRIENRLKNVLFRTNRERTIAILLELVESHGRRDKSGWEIRPRLSHQDLAGLIGSTRETVTLTLGQLQREGLIRIDRRRIYILNSERLRAEAAGEIESDSADGRPARKKVKPI